MKPNPDLVRALLRAANENSGSDTPFISTVFSDSEIAEQISQLNHEKLLHGESRFPGLEESFNSAGTRGIKHTIKAISPFGRKLVQLMGDDKLWTRAKAEIIRDDKSWSWKTVAAWLERESLKQ